MPFIPWCMIIWKNYVFDKPLLAYTHLTFREEWVLLFFHQPVFPFQWLATGRGFSPSIKDKEDGSYHTRTDPLTLASSRISKSVQTYPLCIQVSSWFGFSIFDWTCETIRSITFSAFPVSIASPGTYHQNKDRW
jgi:hypothetical protein